MARLLAWLPSLFHHTHACPRCRLWIQVTGEPSRDPWERLIQSIVGHRGPVRVHWLEDQVARALYDQELRQGGWTLDMGIWGPMIFPEEAVRMIEAIRPEFARVTEEPGSV